MRYLAKSPNTFGIFTNLIGRYYCDSTCHLKKPKANHRGHDDSFFVTVWRMFFRAHSCKLARINMFSALYCVIVLLCSSVLNRQLNMSITAAAGKDAMIFCVEASKISKFRIVPSAELMEMGAETSEGMRRRNAKGPLIVSIAIGRTLPSALRGHKGRFRPRRFVRVQYTH